MSETVTYRQAVTRALADELQADATVLLLGEDIARAGGVFKATEGLHTTFGDARVRDTPISEQAIIGASIGSALLGVRPVAELMFADFAAVAFDQLVNQLAKYRYMTGGQVTLPVTVRLAGGASGGFGAQHSQTCENWFLNVPGLKIVVPATPTDAYGLLRAAIRDDDPVLVFEHKGLYNLKGDAAALPAASELGRAAVVRPGTDVTVVASQLMLHRSIEAAEALASEGISVEVIDPRCLVPFDMDTVLESVGRTSRLVVAQEGPGRGSWGASLLAEVVEREFELLDAPPALVAADEVPLAYAEPLEDATIPTAARIAAQLRRTAEF